jgi:hypothetical protein
MTARFPLDHLTEFSSHLAEFRSHLTFLHRTNYGKFEPVNNAIINFNKYCHWFGFCGEVGRDMFRDRLKSALSGERFDHRRLQ